MYFDSLNKADCCGCTACVNACPVTAIRMKEDEDGFLYPIIDESICINCGLCRRVCCWEYPQYNNEKEPITLASVLKDKTERQRSTSGGIFYAIAAWIIEQGGMVYGAAFDDNLQLKHIGAETIEELQPIRGSKYLQSNLAKIFKDVEKNLRQERWCYFTGTGCQIAGLKAYLRKDYSKLITSDVVCHGVPSQKLFNHHIEYIEQKYHNKVVDYKFRDYKLGGVYEICSFANQKPVINRSYELSPYLYSFMYGMTYRESCYECRFAKIPRQGDISLADYWGVKKFFPQFDNSNGCSLLLLNTDKGRIMWEQIKTSCTFEESNVNDAASFNGNLVHPTSKPEIRNVIYKEIKDKGYDVVAKQLFRSPKYSKLKVINYILNSDVLKPIVALYHKVKK